MSLSAGARLGPYEILSPLGRGGMGEVYRARHTKLGRDVAVKVLPSDVAADRERLHRFEREARLASSLDHPNIVTIYDIGEQDGTTFIAMELVEGQSLRQLAAEGPLPVARVVSYAMQIGEGLARAHEAGVVHRDLKPENVIVTRDGRLKILDFGIAKHLTRATTVLTEASTTLETTDGAIVGTPRYMSPEQLRNGTIDHRSDQFAFGIVLYELLAGKPPFDGPSLASIITAITHDPPPPLEPVRRDVPAALAKVIRRCLAKNPNERFATMAEVCDALAELRGRAPGFRGIFSPRAVATAAAVILAFAGIGWFMWSRGAERRWAEREAPPQIASLIDAGNVAEAFRLARRAERATPGDPELAKLVGRISFPLHVATKPPGAEVAIRKYEAATDEEWDVLGTTPLDIRIPYALVRLRIRKEGFETMEGAPMGSDVLGQLTQLELNPAGTAPVGTVRVLASRFRGGSHRLALPGGAGAIPIAPFWIDRYEVTNRDFRRFVDAGGYRDGATWPDGFGPGETPWSEARQRFVDATGRPGPSTWTLGTYPEGADDLPVGGVSWYEAAAYCRWAGKTLPTIYHWLTSIGQEQLSDIQRLSNFDGKGPAAVGSYQAIAGYGSYDMAGNVKEWCWNSTTNGLRYALGGAWNDPSYFFRHVQAAPPLERAPTHGFRCAVYDEPPEPALLVPSDPAFRIAKLPPISDEVFEAYRGLYGYDRTGLRPAVESRDLSSPHWIKELVSFDAAYGGERMSAYIFLPRNAKPPYQVVLWFPGDDADIFRTSETLASSYLFDFIPRSGRALVYPIYYGLYERYVPMAGANAARDRVLFESKDIGRTLDYLETRPDLDTTRLAYYGFSGGANQGPIFAAVEPRIRSVILLAGGLLGQAKRPETAPAHFAPRCRVPALMINGVDDFIFPYEAQKALYDALAASPVEKRHARLPGGHIPSDHLALIREVLDWLDRWQGPIETAGPAPLAANAR